MEVITANSLGDGRVVFLSNFGWSHDIGIAQLLVTKEAVADALARANADAAANLVVEPYAIEVKGSPAGLVPVRLRERIRAEGPTTGNSKNRADVPPPPCGEGLGEGLAPPRPTPKNPSPSGFAATLSPQGGEGPRASAGEL